MLKTREAVSNRRVNALWATLGTVILLLVISLIVRPHLNPMPDTILTDGNEQLPSPLRGNDWLRWVELVVFSWLGLFGAVTFFRTSEGAFRLRHLAVWVGAYSLLMGGVMAVSRGWYAGLERVVVSMLILAGVMAVVGLLAVIFIAASMAFTVVGDWVLDRLEDSSLGDRVQPVLRYFRAEDIDEPDYERVDVYKSDDLVK